jgi:hypothetical protein
MLHLIDFVGENRSYDRIMSLMCLIPSILNLQQQRLEQTVSEVTRLRNERSRLMDVGNELRAALNRVSLS